MGRRGGAAEASAVLVQMSCCCCCCSICRAGFVRQAAWEEGGETEKLERGGNQRQERRIQVLGCETGSVVDAWERQVGNIVQNQVWGRSAMQTSVDMNTKQSFPS